MKPAANTFNAQREYPFSPGDFRRVRELISRFAGIALAEHKENMVYNRLARRLRSTGTGSFGEYLDLVERPDSDERGQFVNALTTNLTSFFREGHHFEMLASYAAARRRDAPGGGRLRVWSSACSTGEEPYSAAIVLREADCPAEIVATDIDTEVLNRAQRGSYALEAAENMQPERLRRFFLKGVGTNEGRIMVRPELQAMVRFSPCNLQGNDWPSGERFDVIFCRNVMIYFSKESQRQVLDRFIDVLRPGGLLFVGHSESYATGHAALRNCGKTAYERRAIDSPRAS
jgi:chemotaxis protein methyltransferase CheR